MNLSCDIVMDLIPLYKDKLASPDSVKSIESHLKTCPSCRTYYKKYNPSTSFPSYNVPVPSIESKKSFESIRKKLQKRHNISVATIGSIVLLSVSVAIFSTARRFTKNNIK